MKYGLEGSLIFHCSSYLGITMSMTFVQNSSFGQAVELIPIQIGNVTLEKGHPGFYDCIDEKIDKCEGVEIDPYFEKEPTNHEVTTRYNEVFFDNSDPQSSIDNSDHSDFDRFNSLFGFTG